MSRWSARYRALSIADTVGTVDTVDTVGAETRKGRHRVHTVNSVTKGDIANDTERPIPCTRCGAASDPIEVVNFDLWLCAACWPGDPNDAAHDATERAAIMAEAGGGPAAEVLHHLPVSWADPAIAPTPGARCRCCRGASWWCEAERRRASWRCMACHPPHGAGPVRVIET